jgi:hypothetical protein
VNQRPPPAHRTGSRLASHFGRVSEWVDVLKWRELFEFLPVPYHTIPYHTIPYHTIPYHTIPFVNAGNLTGSP